MTREEAIKIINCYDIGFHDLSGEKIPADKLVDAFDMAIEALQREEAEEKGYCHRIRPSNVEVVVRCEDCKWYGKEECSMSYLLDRGGGDEEVRWNCEYDDFRSWGERKGGDSK